MKLRIEVDTEARTADGYLGKKWILTTAWAACAEHTAYHKEELKRAVKHVLRKLMEASDESS